MRLLFNIIFALLGFGAIILEFFVPSAGVIGVLGAGFVITGIVLTFTNFGIMAGTIFLIACAIIGPTIMFFYFKLFPKSYIGKKLILNKIMDSSEGYVAGGKDKDDDLLDLEGVAVTNLRPIGEAEINNKRYNVTTLGDYIIKKSKIKVIKIDGNTIIVARKESL